MGRTIMIEAHGKVQPLRVWAVELGLRPGCIVQRLARGITGERALAPNTNALMRGHRKTYVTWRDMNTRCHDPGHRQYPNYGGRGIVVCERWRASCHRFLLDMGPRPVGMEIDRINNDGDYEPGNCRWVTKSVNVRNRRVTRMLTWSGGRASLGELAEQFNVNVSGLWHRLKIGWDTDRALTTPGLAPYRCVGCGFVSHHAATCPSRRGGN